MRLPAFAPALLLMLLAGPHPEAHGQQVVSRMMLSSEGAKRVMAAAEAEAERNNWTVAIAIVDASGDLVAFQRRDGTQPGSVEVAIGKARSAARFKRPTRAFEDMLDSGRIAVISIDDLTPLEGGLPIIVNGEVVGGIGVSGVTAQQDALVAEAGSRAVAP